ncbi:MAG: hypothetical protein ACHP7O_08425 [Burkholderiales bacterium]
MEKTRASKTPEQKLAALMEKQKKLSEQISRQKKIADKRERDAMDDKLKRVGKLFVDAGLLDVPESALLEVIAEVARRFTGKVAS